MVSAEFCVSATSDKIWNYTELIKFLVDNQYKSITLTVVPEAVCLTNVKLYNILDCFSFKSVNIKTWNPFEHHKNYNIVYNGKNFWFQQTKKINVELHKWTLLKKFFCFYHRPTAARLGIASHLRKHYNNESHIHFSINTDIDNIIHFELDKLLSWDINSINPAGALLTELPLLLGPTDNYTAFNGYDYSDPLTDLYKDILIDIVVESHVAGNTFFPTEKTLRPILLKKPFIIFASKNYLEYLRQMGFRTFSDFWNEDYDGYDTRDRYTKIIELIDWLGKLSYQQLETMYWDMQYTLEHNYSLLVNKKFQNEITQI